MKKMRLGASAIVVVVVVLLVIVGFNALQVYSGVMWLGHLALASETRASDTLSAGASYPEVTARLGESDWQAPGFQFDGRMDAGVAVWELGGGQQLRALVWRNKVVAAREGEWRAP